MVPEAASPNREVPHMHRVPGSVLIPSGARVIPIHVLIVEDSEIDAIMVRRLLKRGHMLEATSDHVPWLKAALTAVENKKYDVILLDLGLKDSQGIDTATAIIRAAPNVPVIVMSGREDLTTAQAAMRAGAQSFIVKSSDLSAEELERIILYALERKRIDLQAKEMLIATKDRLSEPGEVEQEDLFLLEPHLIAIETAVGQVETYLARNSPAAYETVRTILDQCGYFTACREMRSIIDLNGTRPRSAPLSDRAMDALGEGARKLRPRIDTPTQAKQAFADALLDFDEKLWGNPDD